MQQSKNILILVERFGQGGAEKVASMLADMLYDSGHYQVYLYSLYKPAQLPHSDGVIKGSLDIEPVGNALGKLQNYYLRIKRLHHLKKTLKVHLTISSLWPVDWINVITGTDKRIAVIQINILNNEQNVQMVKLRRLVSTLYKRFDKIVLGGTNLKTEMTDFFKVRNERLSVILNPINTKQIDANLAVEPPEKLASILEKYQICTVANRLHPIKNTASLVSVYTRLTDHERVRILIIGEGEEKENIQQQITAAGLKWSQLEDEHFDEQAHFYFLNFQHNIHNIIGRSKIFLFPTKGEGLPLALLEAMYCGVPALVSDCPNGGISEAMEAKRPFDLSHPRFTPELATGGYLMPVPDADNENSLMHWKEKIESLMHAENEILGKIRKEGRQRAAQFDQINIGTKWLHLLDKVLNNK